MVAAEFMRASKGLYEWGIGLIRGVYVYCRGAAGREESVWGCRDGKDVGYVGFETLEFQKLTTFVRKSHKGQNVVA